MLVKNPILKIKKQNECHISTYQHSNISLRCTTDHIRNIALVALHKQYNLILNVCYISIKWCGLKSKILWQLSQGKTFSQRKFTVINKNHETIVMQQNMHSETQKTGLRRIKQYIYSQVHPKWWTLLYLSQNVLFQLQQSFPVIITTSLSLWVQTKFMWLSKSGGLH
jgi:hypothetical protein